jgi:hypothetical protein
MSFVGVLSKNPTKYFYPVQSLAPKAYIAATNGSNIDRYRNGGYAALTLQFLPGTWTDGTHNIIVEEADDNGSGSPGTYATVAVADLITGPGATSSAFNAITSAGTAVIQSLDYIGRKRWVRVRNTISGQTTGALFAVVGLLFAPTIFPAA